MLPQPIDDEVTIQMSITPLNVLKRELTVLLLYRIVDGDYTELYRSNYKAMLQSKPTTIEMQLLRATHNYVSSFFLSKTH